MRRALRRVSTDRRFTRWSKFAPVERSAPELVRNGPVVGTTTRASSHRRRANKLSDQLWRMCRVKRGPPLRFGWNTPRAGWTSSKRGSVSLPRPGFTANVRLQIISSIVRGYFKNSLRLWLEGRWHKSLLPTSPDLIDRPFNGSRRNSGVGGLF